MATAKKTTRAKAPARKIAPAKTVPPAPAAKSVQDPAPAARAARAANTAKADKPKKPKLVRDSFTIPKAEYKVIEDSKSRAAALGRPVKKSEVLRAGLKALAGLSDSAFLSALGAVPALKTGRPAKA
ncbi:MAG: hypothetical protein H0X13_08210 [Ramlibacter sp.]|nr:hypothetical protein [Ramlibacter sp.]